MKRLFDEPDERSPIPLAAQEEEVDAILTVREEHELREEKREKQPTSDSAARLDGNGTVTRLAVVAAFSILAIVSAGAELSAEPVAVRKPEGIVHGFLSLRSLEGDLLATGDLIQVPNQERIESRLVFHFLDGSTHDERVVFSQKNVFRLESYHLVQKGPSFPEPLEVDLDRAAKHYRVYHGPANGENAKTSEGEIELPLDVYNGMFFTLLKSLDAHIPEDAKRKVSMVVFTPEPRVVSLEISSQGEDPFTIETSPRRAVHYVLNIEVGGFTGLLADLLGKDPPPLHTWMIRGDAPAFVKFQGFLYRKGPIWSIELASPSWPSEPRKTSSAVGESAAEPTMNGDFPTGAMAPLEQ